MLRERVLGIYPNERKEVVGTQAEVLAASAPNGVYGVCEDTGAVLTRAGGAWVPSATLSFATKPELDAAVAANGGQSLGPSVSVAGVLWVWDGAKYVASVEEANGFDVVLLAGQSNMNGRGIYQSSPDYPVMYVQFGSYPLNQWYREIIDGIDSAVHMPDGLRGPGIGTHFARIYARQRRSQRTLLVVPVAIGGTSVVGGTPRWNPGSPGGDLYEYAISSANAAMRIAMKRGGNARFLGTVWAQGETDGDNSVSQAAYYSAMVSVISGFRERIIGASNSWFAISAMVPEAIDTHPAYVAIDNAHRALAYNVARCTYSEGYRGASSDAMHYNNDALRAMGYRISSSILSLPSETSTSIQSGIYPCYSSTFEATTVDTKIPGFDSSAFLSADGTTPFGGGKCAQFTGSSPVDQTAQPFAKCTEFSGSDVVVDIRINPGTTKTGVILRSQAVAGFGIVPAGYCFSVRGDLGELRIFKFSNNSATPLATASVTNVARFYRFRVVGNTLSALTSLDGITWTSLATANDSTFSSGGVVLTAGFSTAPNGAFFDDIYIRGME